jgi:hypothetical protein
MDPFGWTPEQYTAAGTWATFFVLLVTALILLVTALYAVKQVQVAEKLRRDQTRPYVVPSIDVEQQTIFMLKVENIGKTPAYGVEIRFDEPPRSQMRDVENLRMLTEPIPTMPPGQQFRAYWESALTVFDEKKPYPHPLSYKVTVTYTDGQGQVYGPEGYLLDFRVYEGQAAGPKGMSELVRAVEKLAAEHKKWTDGIRGLRVNTRDAVKEERRSARPSHLRQTRKAYKDNGLKGATKYWIDLWRRRYGLWSR